MPHLGELVKLQSGRWARFQGCSVCPDERGPEAATVLVAVELGEEEQALLASAEPSLVALGLQGIEVRVRLEPDGEVTLVRTPEVH